MRDIQIPILTFPVEHGIEAHSLKMAAARRESLLK
jgi:hypothetical protein